MSANNSDEYLKIKGGGEDNIHGFQAFAGFAATGSHHTGHSTGKNARVGWTLSTLATSASKFCLSALEVYKYTAPNSHTELLF